MAGYTDTEIEAIAGWLKDHQSATQIAARLSAARGVLVTRNAVIGIVHRNKTLKRIGLKGGHGGFTAKKSARTGIVVPPKVKPQAKKPSIEALNIAVRRESKALVRSRVTTVPATAIDGPGKPLPLIALQSGQCRFAVSEDRAVVGRFLFCAAPVADGSSWCGPHRLICTGEGTFPERAASRTLARIAA